MKKLNLIPLNLQQTLVVDEENRSYDPVVGIHDKHRKLVVVRFTTDMEVGKTNPILFKIKEKLESEGLVCDHVLFGDGFGCDTWDKKIGEFDPSKYYEDCP